MIFLSPLERSPICSICSMNNLASFAIFGTSRAVGFAWSVFLSFGQRLFWIASLSAVWSCCPFHASPYHKVIYHVPFVVWAENAPQCGDPTILGEFPFSAHFEFLNSCVFWSRRSSPIFKLSPSMSTVWLSHEAPLRPDSSRMDPSSRLVGPDGSQVDSFRQPSRGGSFLVKNVCDVLLSPSVFCRSILRKVHCLLSFFYVTNCPQWLVSLSPSIIVRPPPPITFFDSFFSPFSCCLESSLIIPLPLSQS